MRVSRRIHRVLGALALLLLAVVPLAAQQATLGDEGVLYTARVGTYGSFFPLGHAYAADASVLVLEVQKPGGERTRLLAPGGETVAPDAVPFVLWEEASRRLFMVWEGLTHIHSTVHLVAFDGAAWSAPLQISGHPFTKKSSPRLAITRESYLREGDGKSVAGERTMLHIVWYEDDYGDVHVLYAPLALVQRPARVGCRRSSISASSCPKPPAPASRPRRRCCAARAWSPPPTRRAS